MFFPQEGCADIIGHSIFPALVGVRSELATALSVAVTWLVGIPLVVFMFIVKYAVIGGSYVYPLLNPIFMSIRSSTISRLDSFLPPWIAPIVVAYSLLIFALGTTLPLVSDISLPRAKYLAYLILAPAVLSIVFGSPTLGAVIWAGIFLLSRINVGINIDKRTPYVEFCTPAFPGKFKTYSLPELSIYDRHIGVNLGAFVAPLLLSLYMLYDLRNHVLFAHPPHPLIPVEIVPYFVLLLLFLTALFGSARSSFGSVIISVSIVALYAAFIFGSASAISGVEGENFSGSWTIEYIFAATAFAFIIGADILRGTLFDLARKKLPIGTYGGGCEEDALLAAPIVATAVVVLLNCRNLIASAPAGIAGFAVLSADIAIAAIGIIAVFITLWAAFVTVPFIAVGAIVAWLIFGEKGLETVLGIAIVLLIPIVTIHLASQIGAVAENDALEEDILQLESHKIESIVKDLKEQIWSEIREKRLDYRKAQKVFQREYERRIENLIERYVNETKIPQIRKVKIECALGKLPQSSSLKKKLEEELEKLKQAM